MENEVASRTRSSDVGVSDGDGAAVKVASDINRFLRFVAYAPARAGGLMKRALMIAGRDRRTARRYASGASHMRHVTSLGEPTASIAHEVNQPLGAILFNAEACISWLDCDPPNMNEVRAALQRIFRDGTRACEVIRRVRALARKADTTMVPIKLEDVLSEALSFVHHELSNSRVAVRMEHASALPPILADKVQLQQVILNLVRNGIEAMQPITDRPRELVIRSEQDDAQRVRVTVTDCGVGFPADSADRLFNTSFTTKSSGMGIGLSICRSIIELHGGRIWAVPNMPYGASIQLTLPLHPEDDPNVATPRTYSPSRS